MDVKAEAGIEIDITLLSVFRIKAKHIFNLAKLAVGAQIVLSNRYFDNFCIELFTSVEAVSFNHKVKTNTISCFNDVVSGIINKVDFAKMHKCTFLED